MNFNRFTNIIDNNNATQIMTTITISNIKSPKNSKEQ